MAEGAQEGLQTERNEQTRERHDLSNAAVRASRQGGKLTPRQAEALDLAADGYTLVDIAGAMNRSPDTVAKHLTGARRVLGARNTIHAFRLACRSGELKP